MEISLRAAQENDLSDIIKLLIDLGSKLLIYTKKLALDKKVKRIILSTNRERESYKRGFYLKYGFVEKNSAWMNLDL
jgi:hypothetical protein